MRPQTCLQADIEPLARQLLEQAQLLARLRHDLDRQASEVTDMRAELVTRLDDLHPARPAPATSTRWCWRDLSQGEESELADALDEWVGWLRSRYPLARRIPACWSRHPEVVEELTGLWLAWQAAYEATDAPLTGPADWHDRWLPGFLGRIEHGAFALSCRTEHAERPTSAYAKEQGANRPVDN